MGLPRQQMLLTDFAGMPGCCRGSAVQGRCPDDAPRGPLPLENEWLQKSMSLD